MTTRRLRRLGLAVARRTGGGEEIAELVEGRFAAVPLARRRATVRRYLAEVKVLYPRKKSHAEAHGVRGRQDP